MFGDKIKQYRSQQGLTQKQLAESLGITSQTVSNWESGRSQPSKLVQSLLNI